MSKREIERLAEDLEAWAKMDKGRETLVKWLLTRTVAHHFEGTEGKIVIERTDITEFDIKKAVRQAMADCKPNPGWLTTGLTRGGPTWPRAYDGMWPKAYGC